MNEEELEQEIAQLTPSAMKMVFYAGKKQKHDLLKYALEGVGNICEIAAVLKDYGTPEQLQQLQTTVQAYVLYETQIQMYMKAIQKAESHINSPTNGTVDLDAILGEENDLSDINYKEHEYYRKFCEAAGIEQEYNNEDEDVICQEAESARSVICPITQMEIVDPLKNPQCGHTFSKLGITTHLRRKDSCPVGGCQAILRLEELERDVEMEVILARTGGTAAFTHEEPSQSEEFLVE